MNIYELDASLPNGFHDATLHSVVEDATRREVWVELDFHVGDLDDTDVERREEYRRGRVRLCGAAISTSSAALLDGLRSQMCDLVVPPADPAVARLFLCEFSRFGNKFEIPATLVGPTGASVSIVTVWIVRHGENVPRFVTAIPGDKT